MNYNNLPPEIQAIAETTLTPNQLQAWQLELAGQSQWAIAYNLQISRQAARDRLNSATIRLLKAGVRQDAAGNWTHQET